MNESTVYTCVTRRVTLVTNPVIIMNESTVFTCVTRRVTLVTNPVISHEWVHCLYMCHLSCYSCYKPRDKSWMSPLSVHVSPVVLLLLQTQWKVMNESTVCTCVTRRVTLVTNPVINHEWVYCLYMCHPSYYSCYKPSDKSWMSPLSVHVSLVVLLLLQTQW
jgi:hypothetical protein